MSSRSARTPRVFAPLLLIGVAATAAPALLSATAAHARPVAGSSLKPDLGVYDCEEYTGSGLTYVESIKLRSGHRYQQAYDRHGARLKSPTTHGTYSQRRKIVTFKHGQLNNRKGKVTPQSSGHPALDLILHGESTGIYCYYVRNP
jgi:hypothetical protein